MRLNYCCIYHLCVFCRFLRVYRKSDDTEMCLAEKRRVVPKCRLFKRSHISMRTVAIIVMYKERDDAVIEDLIFFVTMCWFCKPINDCKEDINVRWLLFPVCQLMKQYTDLTKAPRVVCVWHELSYWTPTLSISRNTVINVCPSKSNVGSSSEKE